MTRALFQEWLDEINELNELNEHMKIEDRHVLLLLDNAFAHCAEKLLSNVEIEMLPPNTTSGCPAADVAASVIDDDEKSTKDIYKVDVLQAMHWCRDAWDSMTQSAIANC
uniref:AlNc14C108G6279 protein n=1 Tax=Albugo laibachii Nc14 TaxID=890382 RepID=F0WI73_9STRA|nr:AlNc14C108G6279 [Albugo laibachii Nc14]|eukprot:CCA20951.1 AlNc14C108G6279 [Albugo laibachii Nc14]